jgi:hypothetical protein
MKNRSRILALVLTAMITLAAAPAMAGGDGLEPVEFMSIHELLDKLGDENLVIADVRFFAPLEEGKIKGAVRYEPGAEVDWAGDLDKDSEIVVY